MGSRFSISSVEISIMIMLFVVALAGTVSLINAALLKLTIYKQHGDKLRTVYLKYFMNMSDVPVITCRVRT